MRSLLNSCSAEEGKITKVVGWVELTFVTAVDFGLVNEGRGKDLVGVQEHVGGVCIATANV